MEVLFAKFYLPRINSEWFCVIVVVKIRDKLVRIYLAQLLQFKFNQFKSVYFLLMIIDISYEPGVV